MMRKSLLVASAVGVLIFCASGAVGFGQVLNDLFGVRTVKSKSSGYRLAETVSSSSVISEKGAKLGTPRGKGTSGKGLKLPDVIGVPVQIEARVYHLDIPPPLTSGSVIAPGLTVTEALKQIAAGKHQLIAAPSLVGSSGNLTSFQSVINVTLAKGYIPPTIPKSYVGVVTGGAAVGEKAALKTNESGFILPPHPREFENRDIGLTLTFLPKIEEDGSVSIDCEAENTALGPFADRGTKILREKKALIGKKTKTEVMLENNQFFPTVLSQKLKVSATDKMGATASKMTGAVSGAGEFTAVHGKVPRAKEFAEIIVRDGLPPLLVSVSAKKVNISKPKKVAAFGGESQIYLTVRAVEVSEAQGIHSVLPEIRSGVMTDAEFQVLIRALNSKKGVDLMTAPSMMMRKNQAGKMEVVREFIYPTKYDAPEIPKDYDAETELSEAAVFPVSPAVPIEFSTTYTGIEIGVAARPAEGGSIDLILKPEVTEFKEFLNFGEVITLHDYKRAFGKPVSVVMTENRILMPVFEKCRLETAVRIPDGGMVCLGGFVTNEVQDLEDKVPVLGDLPVVGKAFRHEVELHTQKRLYFFVRAELMDPAGVPITKK